MKKTCRKTRVSRCTNIQNTFPLLQSAFKSKAGPPDESAIHLNVQCWLCFRNRAVNPIEGRRPRYDSGKTLPVTSMLAPSVLYQGFHISIDFANLWNGCTFKMNWKFGWSLAAELVAESWLRSQELCTELAEKMVKKCDADRGMIKWYSERLSNNGVGVSGVRVCFVGGGGVVAIVRISQHRTFNISPSSIRIYD